MAVYTLGIWHVRRGDEDDFVAAWRLMATNTAGDFAGATAVLLRDRDDPGLFVSVGPWDSLEQVDSWRASATFATGVRSVRPYLEQFEPHTMDVVVSIGG